MAEQIMIDISVLYASTETAKIANLNDYVHQVLTLAGNGNVITLTGAAPVWLYLKIAHALHGKVRKLVYRSPVTGDVVIFDHSPD